MVLRRHRLMRRIANITDLKNSRALWRIDPDTPGCREGAVLTWMISIAEINNHPGERHLRGEA
jgi:hypothetical protein